jgi:hypothetical protein
MSPAAAPLPRLAATGKTPRNRCFASTPPVVSADSAAGVAATFGAAPVATTTAVPVPAATVVPAYSMLDRSAIVAASVAAGPLATSIDSPVRLDSSASSWLASISRPSAGTTSPA